MVGHCILGLQGFCVFFPSSLRREQFPRSLPGSWPAVCLHKCVFKTGAGGLSSLPTSRGSLSLQTSRWCGCGLQSHPADPVVNIQVKQSWALERPFAMLVSSLCQWPRDNWWDEWHWQSCTAQLREYLSMETDAFIFFKSKPHCQAVWEGNSTAQSCDLAGRCTSRSSLTTALQRHRTALQAQHTEIFSMELRLTDTHPLGFQSQILKGHTFCYWENWWRSCPCLPQDVGFSQSLSEKVLPRKDLSSLKLSHFTCNQ